MSKFTWWGQPAPTWRTPLRWLRFKLFRLAFAKRVRAKRAMGRLRAADIDWDRQPREAVR